MEQQLKALETKTEKMTLDQNYAQGRVESIMACVQQIFNLVDCDETQHIDLLGTQGVTESNMMTYLGIVEQRINEILQANTYIMNQKQFDSDENNCGVKLS